MAGLQDVMNMFKVGGRSRRRRGSRRSRRRRQSRRFGYGGSGMGVRSNYGGGPMMSRSYQGGSGGAGLRSIH